SQTLDAVKLRNFNNLRVILIGGTCVERKRLQDFRQRTPNATTQLIVLALSETAFVEADSLFPAAQEYIVLEPDVVEQLLDAVDSIALLKLYSRRSLSPQRLNPFVINRVPGSNMFAGRQPELAILQHQDATSY